MIMTNSQIPEIPTEFINLQSDYGFKRSFGTKKYQKNVIKLLEAALGDDINVTRIVPRKDGSLKEGTREVEYHDKEILPSEEKGKRIVYDVYFTVKVGKGESIFKSHHHIKSDREKDIEHHFILEMQNVYTIPFEDRMAYYLAKMVASQGKAGWNYDLDPVILMCVTDFDFPHLTPQLVHEFEWREKITGESLTKKLRMLFYSLKQIPDEWDECESNLQRILYLTKNMDKMNKDSKAYKEGEYQDLFDSAESANLVGEEAVLYSQSLAYLREMQSGLDYRYEEGREEGREEGKEEERENMARKMKAEGFDLSIISRITGIHLDKLANL